MRGLFLICAGICTVAAFSQGQTAPTAPEIRVRILDYKTGQPLNGRKVWLTLFDSEEQYRNRTFVAMEGKTGADGTAVFRFSTGPPPRILVVYPEDFACTEPGPKRFPTETIAQQGIVGNLIDVRLCKPHTSAFPDPHPGELVFYAHRLNLWERIRRAMQE
jgi:hypothetical protein